MTGAERLAHLASVLRGVPRKAFYMDRWVTDRGCGFAGCAVGWGATDPTLNLEGLVLSLPLPHRWLCHPTLRTPTGITSGWSAVEKFFELSSADAEWLFDGDEYDSEDPTPDDVVQRIEEFLNINRPPAARDGDHEEEA